MAMQAESFNERLRRLDVQLPRPPAPAASYVPARREGGVIWVAGQLPFIDGRLARTGRLGVELTTEAGIGLARTAALNCLAVLRDHGVELDLVRAVNVVIYVASGPEYREQHLVANGASQLLIDTLGDAGAHARTTVAVPFLPLDSPLEVQAVFAEGS